MFKHTATRVKSFRGIKVQKPVVAILLALTLFLLSGCSFETHIFIQKGEHWKVEERLSLPQNIGGIGAKIKGLSVHIPIGTDKPITMAFNQIVSVCPQYNWKCNYHKSFHRGEVQYTLIVKGQGYDSMSRFFNISNGIIMSQIKAENPGDLFSGFNVEKQGSQLHIWSKGMAKIDSKALIVMKTLFPIKIVIHAGKIVEANADEIRGGTAIWYSPRDIDVTLEPAMWTFGIPPYLIIGIMVLVLLSVLVLVFSIYFWPSKRPATAVEDSLLPPEDRDYGDYDDESGWAHSGSYESYEYEQDDLNDDY